MSTDQIETITHCPEHGTRLTGPAWNITMSRPDGSKFKFGGTCKRCDRRDRAQYRHGRL